MRTIHGWTLLEKAADYKLWHFEHQAYYATIPPSYPVYVQERISSSEESVYEYLHPAQVRDLRDALPRVEETAP